MRDAGGDCGRIFVFPRTDYGPARGRETLRLLGVPPLVARDLRVPVGRVQLRSSAVLRAAVPEASVDKHRKALTRERDVGPRLPALNRDRVVDAISQPHRMED